MLDDLPAAAPAATRHRAAGAAARGAVSRVLASPTTVLAVVVVIVAALAQAKNPIFLTSDNIVDVLRASVTTFVIGCAATLVFVAGGLDLSVGAVFAFGSVVAGKLMADGTPWPLAVAAGLAVGCSVGLVNAFLILVARVPPIIATLSTLYAVSGVAIVMSDGTPIAPLPQGFADIGQLDVAGVPLLVVYAVVIGLAAHVVLTRSVFGYDVKALGGSPSAATANGIRVRRLSTVVYVLSGAAAALAGILYAARTGTADPQAGGVDVTLAVVAAVLIGGTSLFGGVGSIVGTALGALLFSEIANALTVAGINPLYQDIVLGVILAGAVAADSWRRSQAFRIVAR